MKKNMKIKNLIGIVTIIIPLLNPISVMAWGDIGHKTVGAIAELNLNAEGKRFVRSILGVEPLANAAIWPDLVRADMRFRPFSPYHFFEIPMGSKYSEMSEEMKAIQSAEIILLQVPQELLKNEVSRDEKMILLRYLIHMVGDVHQPLHIGNGIDRGGNSCKVKYEEAGSGRLIDDSNLHSFVDDGIFDFFKHDYIVSKSKSQNSPAKRYFDYPEMAEIALGSLDGKRVFDSPRESLALDLLDRPKAALSAWFDEAIALREKIYPDTEPVNNPSERLYCRTPNVVAWISEAHRLKLYPIIYSQLVLGGLRLAAILNSLGAKASISTDLYNDDWQKQILEKVQLKKGSTTR